jgi:hypothetical protein
MIHEACGFGSSTGMSSIFGFPTAYHTDGHRKQARESCSKWRGIVPLFLNREPFDALRVATDLPCEFIGRLREILHAFWGEPALAGIRSRWQSRLVNFPEPLRF